MGSSQESTDPLSTESKGSIQIVIRSLHCNLYNRLLRGNIAPKNTRNNCWSLYSILGPLDSWCNYSNQVQNTDLPDTCYNQNLQ